MSIIVNNLSYIHPDREILFENVGFSLPDGCKASVVGDNGTGKSTLVRIIAGLLAPARGQVSVSAEPYYVPQHFGQYDHLTVAGVLGTEGKLAAMSAILSGDLSEANYAALADDWAVEHRLRGALSKWGLEGLQAGTRLSSLSGGEKTKVFLAGIDIHNPSVILMDEPTNHLDRSARHQLYETIEKCTSTVLVVSHDRTLLNLIPLTYELRRDGMERYGGNYEFYMLRRNEQLAALRDQLEEKEKAMRVAMTKARHVLEQKQKSDARAPAKHKRQRTLPGKVDKMRGTAQESAARLRQAHAVKMEAISAETRELKEKLPADAEIRIALDNSGLHTGKVLVDAADINFAYPAGEPLWDGGLTFCITSGERIAIGGANGSGKTTLLQIVLGRLDPTAGKIDRADFSSVYIDQEYSLVDGNLSLYGQLELHNTRKLPEHELKRELHRFLFPLNTWDKKCAALSGGEKMRLALCCLLVSDQSPDMLVLDEPTNNLDIKSMEVVTSAVQEYRGTVLVISHDEYFLRQAGVTRFIELDR